MQLSEWLQEKTIEPGLISIYKPYGISSTVITELYKRTTKQKVGHGGTLDPLAEGELLLGIGKGTKLLSKCLSATKSYAFDLLFGLTSVSFDLEQPLIAGDTSMKEITQESLEKVFTTLETPYLQEVPVFSAAKTAGKAAYEHARKGQEVERKYSETRLIEWKLSQVTEVSAVQLQDLLQMRLQEMRKNLCMLKEVAAPIGFYTNKSENLVAKWSSVFEENMAFAKMIEQPVVSMSAQVVVPKGTYIRSLAVDFASKFDTVAVVTRLVRRNAQKIDSLQNL